MPIDPEILRYGSSLTGGTPEIDREVLAYGDKLREEEERKRKHFREAYAWDLSSPVKPVRIAAMKRALEAITDPEDRQMLVEEVAKVSKAMAQIGAKRYQEADFPERFWENLQIPIRAFQASGSDMVESAKELAKGLARGFTGKVLTAEEAQFGYALEAAKQGQNPDLPKHLPIHAKAGMKVSQGMAGMTPDLAAGLAATQVAGPAGAWGYWTARMAPEQQKRFIAQGVDPTTATALGYLTSAASAGIEAMQVDPTGVTSKAVGSIGRKALKQAGRTAWETMEESAQALTEEGVSGLLGVLYPGARGPSFQQVAAAPAQAAREALPGLIGLGVAGVGGAAMQQRAAKRVEQSIRTHAEEKKVPSRRQWKDWGLPQKEGKVPPGPERLQFIQEAAEDLDRRDQARAIWSSTPPTESQWKSWGFPEDVGKTPEDRLNYLKGYYAVEQRTEEGEGEAERAGEIEEAKGVEQAEARKGVDFSRAVPDTSTALAERQTDYEAIPEQAPKQAAIAEVLRQAGVSEAEAEEAARDPSQLGRLIAEGKIKAEEIGRDLRSLIAPATATESARRAGHILREQMARSAMGVFAAREKLAPHADPFYKMPPEGRKEFLLAMDEGRSQATPELDVIANALRTELDITRDTLIKIGKLKEYYENYLPRIFKHRADASTVLGKKLRKQWQKSGFLRKRTIPLLRDALKSVEEGGAGLELITDHPIDLVMHHLALVYEFVGKHNAMEAMKHAGLARFVPASFDTNYLSDGHKFVNDPAFLVQTSADVTVMDAYDKLLRDQLLSVATALGVEHERLARLRSGKGVWGESEKSAPRIKTKVGGPMSVLAHEIGHQIGRTYGLYNWMLENVPSASQELQALAHLRIEKTENVEQEHIEYIESPEEMEAVILEAWLAAPEKMVQVAPGVTVAWKQFLDRNDALRPLLMLDRSVVLGTSEYTQEMPGVRVLGRWSLPTEVATMVENHLSPGLRRNENAFIKTGYNLVRSLGNAMNQASLSLSLFHALNVMTDATATFYGMGLREILRRHPNISGGLRHLALAASQVGAGATAVYKGDVLYNALRTGDIESIEDPFLHRVAELGMMAGIRTTMDARYCNESIKALRRSFYDLRHSDEWKKIAAGMKLPVEVIFAGLEATSWPVMQYLVPRMKLGVFCEMAMDICHRKRHYKLDDFQFREQLTQAWDSIDNRLGQLAYDNLFWNQYLKDFLQLSFRSVGWNLGSLREYVGAITDVVDTKARMARGDQFLSQKMAYTVGAVATYAPLGAILTYLLTGERPKELKDYLFPRTGRFNRDGTPERLSLPTYAKDWVAWGTDPGKALLHKAHPMWGTLGEMWWNEDFYGTEIRNAEDHWMVRLGHTLAHLGEAFVPFSAKNFARMREAGEPLGIALPAAVAGISSAPSYITSTPARKKAVEFLRERMGTGKRTRAEAKAARARKDLVFKLRKGEEIEKADVELLSRRQIKSAAREAKMTPFQSLFTRLSFDEALAVYELASDEEKQETRPILAKKARRAIMTSKERQRYTEILRE